MRSVNRALAVFMSSMIAASAASAGSVTWPFDLTTTGGDVFFTSSTATDPAASQYEVSYEVTAVEVIVRWLIFDIGPVDITSEVPADQLTGSEVIDGPAPVGISDISFEYPPPPETPGFAGTVGVSIDALGIGHGSLTNVTLGTLQFDVGGGNIQTVTLKSVRVIGAIVVNPVSSPGDLDDSGVVDVFDLFILLSAWGDCPGECPPSCPPDLNEDCLVDVFDLFVLLSNWG